MISTDILERCTSADRYVIGTGADEFVYSSSVIDDHGPKSAERTSVSHRMTIGLPWSGISVQHFFRLFHPVYSSLVWDVIDGQPGRVDERNMDMFSDDRRNQRSEKCKGENLHRGELGGF